MRKLAFLSIFALFFVAPNMCIASCGAQHVSYQGTQDPDDDEFIYENGGTFLYAQKQYNAGNKSIDIKGRVWECDQEQGCPDKTFLLAPASHSFTGSQPGTTKIYICDTTPDRWQPRTLTECPDDLSAYKEITVVNSDGRKYYVSKYNSSGNPCYELQAKTDCKKDPYGIWNGQNCQCGNQDGKQREWNSKQKKCIEVGRVPGNAECPAQYKDAYVPCWGAQTAMGATKCYRKCHNDRKGATTMIVECRAGTTPAEENAGWRTADGKRLYAKCVASGSGTTPPPSNGGGHTQSCRDKRSTLNGKACCDTGNLGTYTAENDTCTCSGGLEFVIENGTGFCRAKQGAPVYTCPAEQLSWIANLKISCANSNEIQSQISIIENYCKGTGVSETAFNEYVSQLMTLSAQLCGAQSDEQKLCDRISDAHMVGNECKCDDKNKELNRSLERCEKSASALAAEQEASRGRITSITGKLNNLRSGLSQSVWKNKEGNFNTSRLVSDSVAGVVLGTAGGLITSNVIKKNQVKGGFEDIKCTVRGQVVAGYGDEFQVGIQ